MKLSHILLTVGLSHIAITAVANTVLYKAVQSGSTRGYFVSSGDYQDIRADSQRDKKTKFWVIKKGNLTIGQTFKDGKIILLNIRKLDGQNVSEITYARSGKNLKLIRSAVRKVRSFAYEGLFKEENIKAQLCASRKIASSEIEVLSKKFDEDILQQNLDSKIIDPSCKRGSAQYALIEESLLSVMAPPGKNEFIACLNKDETAQVLSKTYKFVSKEEIKDELNLIALKYSLQASKYMSEPDTLRSKVKCKNSNTMVPPALCSENGEIIHFNPSDESQLPKTGKFKEISYHENLHDLGVATEDVVDNLINACFNRPQKPVESTKAVAVANGQEDRTGHFIPLSLTEVVVADEAARNPVSIPRSIAETAIPNPAPTELNKPFTNADSEVQNYAVNPEGAAKAAYTQSLNSTSGIINFAKSAIGSFTAPAMAAPVQARGLASVASPAAGGYVTKSGSSNSDMNVVKEEILIGQGGPSANSNATSSKSAMEPVTSAKARSVKSADIAAASEVAIDSKAAVSQRAVTNSGGGISAGSGSIRSSSARSPASQSTASINLRSGSSATTSLSDIQKTLVNYDTAVKKLNDPGFRRVLKENKILIINMADKIIFDPGVPKGQAAAVFLDTGSSFVRGNKK